MEIHHILTTYEHDAQIKLYRKISSLVAVFITVQFPSSVVELLLVFVAIAEHQNAVFLLLKSSVVDALNNPQNNHRKINRSKRNVAFLSVQHKYTT